MMQLFNPAKQHKCPRTVLIRIYIKTHLHQPNFPRVDTRMMLSSICYPIRAITIITQTWLLATPLTTSPPWGHLGQTPDPVDRK